MQLTEARVVLQERGLYHIVTEGGEQRAQVSGKFQFDALRPSDFPVVGDLVLADCTDPSLAVIHQVLPRRSLFVRRAAGSAGMEQAVAANIDTVFLCMSLNNDFSLRRLERYLSIAWESGASPVVVLTKADLCADAGAKQLEASSVAMGAPVLTVCALAEDGYAQLLPYIRPDKVVAFVGSSGVGKSTLINRLLGEERLATNGLRDDDKGRHTTTHRELLFLPGGAMVIDTPGMRELGMWDAASGVEQAFAEIEALAASCRYRNCTHSGEPGCAVRAALQAGELDPGRFQSYLKLRAENAYAEDSERYLAAKEQKFREISKINKRSRRNNR